ncbi:Protein of unknown function DUF1764 [Macleaya cordata]|uniref:DUF1764 domain-containing protein n=1 Tax=Macleaya cordata TaxID=56857 RepID=A0A200QML8_MACCD|nr:Protein of unknown function DUF1764 [Macleaya cordata]
MPKKGSLKTQTPAGEKVVTEHKKPCLEQKKGHEIDEIFPNKKKRKNEFDEVEKPKEKQKKPSLEQKKPGNEIDEIFSSKKNRTAELDEVEKTEENSSSKREKVKKKKKKSKASESDGFVDPPSRPRKKTNDGLTVYTEEELGISKSDAGGTPLCPFDCSCCF